MYKSTLQFLSYRPLFIMGLLFSFCKITANGQGQTCPIVTHNAFTDFNASSNPGTATTLWFNLHTKLNGQLSVNGDFLLFSNGTLSFKGISTSFGSSASLPNGEIIADNTVTTPTTSFDSPTNTWITRVPLGYKSSDLFLSGAAINSSTGYSLSGGGKATVLAGSFSSNKTFSTSWFYGLAAYQPTFTNSTAGSINAANGIPNGGRQAGTPNDQTSHLVHGGSGGGGSNFTGSNSSTDNVTTCQQSACNSSLTVSATVINGDFEFLCDGEVTVDVTGGQAPYTFTWSDGVTTSSGSRDNLCGPSQSSPPIPVQYTVVVTDVNGCSGSTTFFIDITTLPPPRFVLTSGKNPGVAASEEIVNTTIAKVYPNPSNGLVHLQVGSKEKTNATINVIDMTGRIIKTFVIALERGINNKDLQLQIRSGGVYMLQIKTSKEIRTVPIHLIK